MRAQRLDPAPDRQRHVIEKWLFVALEIADGGEPTITSDLYGLGVLLYFFVSRRPPFTAETRRGLRTAMAKGAPPQAGVQPRLVKLVRTLFAPQIAPSVGA